MKSFSAIISCTPILFGLFTPCAHARSESKYYQPNLYSGAAEARCIVRGDQPVWFEILDDAPGADAVQNLGQGVYQKPEAFESLKKLEEQPIKDPLSDDTLAPKELLGIRDYGRPRSLRSFYGGYLPRESGYLKVTLKQMSLSSNTDILGSSYYPALKTSFKFIHGSGEADFDAITQPTNIEKLEPGKSNRVLVRNRIILAPTPYMGSDFQVEFGLVGVKDRDLAEAALGFIGEVSEIAGTSSLSAALPVVRNVRSGLQRLLSLDDQYEVKVGIATSWPTPRLGYYGLVWPNRDFNRAFWSNVLGSLSGNERKKFERVIDSFYEREGFNQCRLRILDINSDEAQLVYELDDAELKRFLKNKAIHAPLRKLANKLAPGDPLREAINSEGIIGSNPIQYTLTDYSWALLDIDAYSENPNWLAIPGLLDAYRNLRTATNPDEKKGAFKRLELLILQSPDLLERDQNRLVCNLAKRFRLVSEMHVDVKPSCPRLASNVSSLSHESGVKLASLNRQIDKQLRLLEIRYNDILGNPRNSPSDFVTVEQTPVGYIAVPTQFDISSSLVRSILSSDSQGQKMLTSVQKLIEEEFGYHLYN